MIVSLFSLSFWSRNKVAVLGMFKSACIHMLMALICGRAGLWPLAVSCNQLAGRRKSGMLRSHSWIAAATLLSRYSCYTTAHSTHGVS